MRHLRKWSRQNILNEKIIVNHKYINKKCSGSCDRHKMAWNHNQFFLGCPMCFSREYVDMGYVKDNYGVPKAHDQFFYKGKFYKV